MGDRGRVLVVEDDEAIRRLLAEVLAIKGYEVVEVVDGPSAHPAAAEHRPDVILLDIGLPGLDGFGVLELLKGDAELRDIPVLMVTAWAEPALVRRALDRGAYDYVRKPFDVADLGARVDAAAHVGRAARRDAPGESGERPAALAAIDPQTLLADREAMTQQIERHVAAARRGGDPFSLLMVGLDGFAEIAETHGEEAACAVLRALARRLEQRARVTDSVGRWNGETFALIAADADADGAATLADDLRSSLASAPLGTEAAAVRVSVSIGIAAWDDETADQLTARCGAALAGGEPVQLAAAA